MSDILREDPAEAQPLGEVSMCRRKRISMQVFRSASNYRNQLRRTAGGPLHLNSEDAEPTQPTRKSGNEESDVETGI